MPTKPKLFKGKSFGERKVNEHKRKKRFDRTRLSSYDRGYTPAWSKAALAYRKANPVCVHCKLKGIISPAEEVDHIQPHKGIEELFWDESNWQSLCKSCHSRKTAKETSFAGV